MVIISMTIYNTEYIIWTINSILFKVVCHKSKIHIVIIEQHNINLFKSQYDPWNWIQKKKLCESPKWFWARKYKEGKKKWNFKRKGRHNDHNYIKCKWTKYFIEISSLSKKAQNPTYDTYKKNI